MLATLNVLNFDGLQTNLCKDIILVIERYLTLE